MNMLERRLRYFGIFGIISLLSYSEMVIFSPLAYPGYDWLKMVVSELSAEQFIWALWLSFDNGCMFIDGLC